MNDDPKFQVSRDLMIKLCDLAKSMETPEVPYRRDNNEMLKLAYDKRGEILRIIHDELAAIVYYV